MIIGLNLAKDSDTTFGYLCKRWQYASGIINFINLLDSPDQYN